MINKAQKRGFTLIEVLIAASIFSVVITISTSIIFDIINTEKRTDILNGLYEDGKIAMEQLTSAIHDNAIDYEEYFSINVVQPNRGIVNPIYGLYYGAYASRFYDPGKSYMGNTPSLNPADLGVWCSDDQRYTSSCQSIYLLSRDQNVGQNPWNATDDASQKSANAFCDTNLGTPVPACASSGVDKTPFDFAGSELYLINKDGTKKTIFVRKVINMNMTDYASAIGKLEMDGVDTDQNGNIDLFKCAKGYSCALVTSYPGSAKTLYYGPYSSDPTTFLSTAGITTIAEKSSLKMAFNFHSSNNVFIPITPFRTSIKNLTFIINPVEDPYKAFAEAAVQTHPFVTIIMTIEPSPKEKLKYPGGKPPVVTIQRTVTAGIHGNVTNYPPTTDLSWLDSVL